MPTLTQPIPILADASLPYLDALFEPPFQLTCYHSLHELEEKISHQQVLLCRSTLAVTPKLLAHSTLACIATASSGVDHIDTPYLKTQGIQLFDAKGSNAKAVTDYVIACLAWLDQQGLWLKGKRKAGVIGMGKVGSLVALQLKKLGLDVRGCDPIRAAAGDFFEHTDLMQLQDCDVLCIHANLHDDGSFPSRNLINHEFLGKLQPNTVLINASRGGIVNEEALLHNPIPLIYCTDVYAQEPAINPNIVEYARLCTPHIAGHSIEAKKAAMVHISQQLHDHYQLPMPIQSPVNTPVLQDSLSNILNLYDPSIETLALKKAIDKKSAFLDWRKRHVMRREF